MLRDDLVKALGLPRKELFLALEFLYSRGLITYRSGDMLKLTFKGMVTIF
jgi:uncharacterized membrane protein